MSAPPSPTLSDSALLDSLDDSEVFNLEKQRERRIEELQSKIKWVKHNREEVRPGHGEMNVFKDEKLLVERIAKEPYVIIHFFHPDFERCHIMDSRLTAMAPSFRNTLFVRASVADSLFLVAKFEVKVLPCVMCFVHGRCVDRLIGFEDFAEGDAFSVKSLEFRLKHSGVLPTGPLALTDALPTSLTRKDDSDEEPDSEDERWRGKTGVQRKGKTGIRNGFATSRPDEDEDF